MYARGTDDEQLPLQMEVRDIECTEQFGDVCDCTIKRWDQNKNEYVIVAQDLVECGIASLANEGETRVFDLSVSFSRVDSWKVLKDFEERFKYTRTKSVRDRLIRVDVTNTKSPDSFYVRIRTPEVRPYFEVRVGGSAWIFNLFVRQRMQYQLTHQMSKNAAHVPPTMFNVKLEEGKFVTFSVAPTTGDSIWCRGEVIKRIRATDTVPESEVRQVISSLLACSRFN